MIKKIWSVFTVIIVAAVLILAATFAVTKLMGGGVYTILSGSMEPTYHVGSIICVRQVDPEELKEGDVITFAISEEMTATHRIVGITEDKGALLFTTKGDANDSNDANPVDSRNVIGKPMISLPYLGYLMFYAKRPPGIYIAIALIILTLASVFVKGGNNQKRTDKGVARGGKSRSSDGSKE